MSDVRALLYASVLLALFVTACAPKAEPPAPAAPLRLYVFDCGTIQVDDVGAFNLTEEEAGTHELFVPCYLVEHPKGRLLWELGLPLGVITGEFTLPEGSMTLERSLEAQLGDMGLTKADIDWVAVSHLHFDHCGQVGEFADRPQLVQRAEFEAAMQDPPTVPFYEPGLYAALAGSEVTLVEGEHDVFGDGRVVLRLTPGHTPGHQILFVDLATTGPLVLSGDLYHYPANRSLQRPPTFNVDAEQTLASMQATEAFLAESGATLWIEHDAALAATLAKAPAFYE